MNTENRLFKYNNLATLFFVNLRNRNNIYHGDVAEL